MTTNIPDDPDNQHKYLQIRDALLEHVEKLEPGSRLTSERELARQLGCNFLTVRKAMLLLVEQGLIIRRIGSGTYVATPEETEAVLRSAADGEKFGKFLSHKARGSRSDAPRTMGVLIHSASDSYGLQIVTALQNKAQENGLRLCCRMVSRMDGSALPELNALAQEDCAAVILPWYPTEENSYVAELARRSPLPVSLPFPLPGLERNYFERPELFGRNLITGIENLGLYLHRCGWQNIAFFGPDRTGSPILQKNLCGYGSFTSRNSLPSLIGLAEANAESVDAIAERWRGYAGKLAVISYDDDHALRFLTAMHKFGFCAPADFGIASFGNSAVALLADPPLTCVYHDFDYPAGWLLKNALALAEGGCAQADAEARLHLEVRQSCGGRSRLGGELESIIRSLGFYPSLPAKEDLMQPQN